MKKRCILSVGVLFILLCLCYVLNPLRIAEVNVNYEIITQNSDSFQLYYRTSETEYSEEDSYNTEIGANDTEDISQRITCDYNLIRLDLGTSVNVVDLNKISITYGWLDSKVDLTDYIAQNDIASNTVVENSLAIETSGTDPYLEYDISEALQQLQDQWSSVSNILYLIGAVVITLFFFLEYKHLYQVYHWCIDIVSNWPLIMRLARNDFKTRFAASYLGITWAFVQPVVTVVIYVFVFQYRFNSGSPVEGVSYVLWLIAGIVPWFFFQEALLNATNSLIEYTYLVKKVVFKINILPLVKVVSSLFVHLFFILVAIILYLINGNTLTLHIIQVVYYTMCAIVLVVGLSYITSSVVVFFRDLGQIVNILLQFGMWLTPIMWDISTMGIKASRIVKLNPLYYIVTGYRDSFYARVWFWERPGLTCYFWGIAILILIGGMYIFKKLEKHFADVL